MSNDRSVSDPKPNLPSWKKSAQDVLKRDIPNLHAVGGGRVVLCVDVSGSMNGSKLNHAKDGALGFHAQAKTRGYKSAVVSFGSEASVVAEFGASDRDLKEALKRLTTTGSTAMDLGLAMAAQMLDAHRGGKKAVAVVTDGYPDDPEAALRVGDRLKSAGVDIITLGTPDADTEFLARLASRRDLATVAAPADLATGIKAMSNLLALPKN